MRLKMYLEERERERGRDGTRKRKRKRKREEGRKRRDEKEREKEKEETGVVLRRTTCSVYSSRSRACVGGSDEVDGWTGGREDG